MFKGLFMRLMAPDDPPGGGTGDPPSGDPPTGDPPTSDPPAPGKLLGSGAPPSGGISPDGKWSWGENLLGEGTVPPWFKADKYKTISDQARAAPELEAKLGPAAELIGAPEGDYVLPKLPDGVEGNWDPEDSMLKQFMVTAKEMGLSQTAFDKVATSMASLLATENAEAEVKISDALAALGTNSVARIEAVDTYLIATLGEPGWNSLQDAIGTDVKAYLALESLVAKASGDAQLSTLPGKRGPGFTKSDIEAEQFKLFPEDHKLAGKAMYEHDKEHRAKVDGMWKELFPGEARTEVG